MQLSLLSLTAALLTSSAALADLNIPEGETGTLLHLDRSFEIVARVPGLDNVHGLAGAPKRDLLVAGSLSESMPGEIAKPTAVSEEEHAAHHGGGTRGGQQRDADGRRQPSNFATHRGAWDRPPRRSIG